jgi:hypothetical protein
MRKKVTAISSRLSVNTSSPEPMTALRIPGKVTRQKVDQRPA